MSKWTRSIFLSITTKWLDTIFDHSKERAGIADYLSSQKLSKFANAITGRQNIMALLYPVPICFWISTTDQAYSNKKQVTERPVKHTIPVVITSRVSRWQPRHVCSLLLQSLFYLFLPGSCINRFCTTEDGSLWGNRFLRIAARQQLQPRWPTPRFRYRWTN